MSEPLDVTRRKLRGYLLPESAAADDSGIDHFPRSKVMRFAFNPRNRRLLMFSGSVLAVLATRLVGPNRLNLVTELARSFRNKN